MRVKTLLATTLAGVMATGLFATAAPAAAAEATTTPSAENEVTAKTYTVTAWGGRTAVRSQPTNQSSVISSVIGDYSYTAECWLRAQTVYYRGYENDVWVRLRLNSGGTGWVTAITLTGDYKAGLPANARC